MLALLAAATAALQPVDVVRADQLHSWRPGREVVAYLEGALHVPDRMGGPLGRFDRYYSGVYRDGRRIVAVELVNLGRTPSPTAGPHVVKPLDAPLIADGGCGVMRMAYDPARRAASDLVCNAELPRPPDEGG